MQLNTQARREAIAAYGFLSPALFLFIIFLAGPLLASVVISFLSWSLLGPPSFSGLDNYRQLISDEVLWRSLRNTFVFSFWSVVLHIVFGLLLAVGINSRIPKTLSYSLKIAYVFPFLLSWSAVSLLWNYVLDPNFGIFNYYLELVGFSPPNWLVSEHALSALIGVDFWKTLGYTFIILLAGLQTIPRHLYEAAQIDGANSLKQFVYITLPMLSPTLFFAFVITFIGAFQIFDPMYIMTKGGPGDRTRSIVQYLYEVGFQRFEMGYAATLSLVVFFVIMLATAIQFRLSRRWVHYE